MDGWLQFKFGLCVRNVQSTHESSEWRRVEEKELAGGWHLGRVCREVAPVQRGCAGGSARRVVGQRE